MITAGIDCGAKNTKTVLVSGGKVIGRGLVLTGIDQENSIQASLISACGNAGISEKDLKRFGATGSGKNSVTNGVVVNDIEAIGRCAVFLFPDARTVLDVGAEEGRAAKLDEKGNGVDFVLNEKCAAGAGAFFEAMSRALEIPLTEMGPLALKSEKGIPMNAQCAVFAECETVGLIHAGAEKRDICKAVHDAMASRIVSMVRRIGVNPEVVMLGGVAHNAALVEAVRRQLAIRKLLIPENPEFGAALGAALAAAERE